MTSSAQLAYRFNGFRVDPVRRLLFGADGEPIALKPKVFDTLLYLVERPGVLVDKQALLEAVWPHVVVEENNLNKAVSTLRQVFGETRDEHRFIVTEPGRGYRFVASVEAVPAVTMDPLPARDEAAIPPLADGAPAPTSRHAPASAPRDNQSKRPHLMLASAAIAAACALAAIGVYWLAGERTESADIAARAPLPNSVAVLPFDNLSPEPDDAYFAAGMQDEVVRQLTNLRGLSVIPVRGSAGEQTPIPEVLRGLRAATVLGGSVYYSKGRVRVTPRLTDAATGVSLWSYSYEKELSDIFSIQSEIAIAVARALSVELSATERERLVRVPTTNPQARDLYLMARARSPNSRDELLLGIAEVEQALVLDPAFKEAWVLSSNHRNYAAVLDPEHADEHRPRGEEAAGRALELDPELGIAHAMLGWSLASKRDWRGAEAAFRSAERLNVPSAEMGSYAFLQLSAGKFGPFARNIFEEMRWANPGNETIHRFLAFVHAGLGDWERASALYESGMSLFRDNQPAALAMLNQKMHWLVGRNELEEARAITIADPLNAAMLASLDAPEKALAELRRAYAATVAGNPNRRRDIGLWAGHFGNPVLALDAMRAAVSEQGGQTVYLWLPQLAPMRRLPEFKTYMRDIGMVEYWQEYDWPTFCRPVDGDDFDCD